jgi:hypothetical protein
VIQEVDHRILPSLMKVIHRHIKKKDKFAVCLNIATQKDQKKFGQWDKKYVTFNFTTFEKSTRDAFYEVLWQVNIAHYEST